MDHVSTHGDVAKEAHGLGAEKADQTSTFGSGARDREDELVEDHREHHLKGEAEAEVYGAQKSDRGAIESESSPEEHPNPVRKTRLDTPLAADFQWHIPAAHGCLARICLGCSLLLPAHP